MELRAGRLLEPGAAYALATALGFAAAMVVVVLLQASLVWAALALIGLVTLVAALVIGEGKKYWLAIFVFCIPINLTKMFFYSPADVALLRTQYELHQIDVLVPLVYVADLPLLVLLFQWLGEILMTRVRFRFPKPLLIMLAFVVWCLGTLLQARVPQLGLTWIFYHAKLLVIFLWFYNARLDKGALRLAVAVLVAGVAIQGATSGFVYYKQMGGENILSSLLGLQTSQTLRGDRERVAAAFVFESKGPLRGTGTVGIANDQAKYFVMCLPLALVSGLFAPRRFSRPFYLLAFALGMAGLYFTYSRGGMLSALVALTVLLLLLVRRGLINRKLFVTLAAIGVLGAAAASPFLYSYLTTRPGFYDIRFQHVQYGTEMVLGRPFFGVGINNFNVSISEFAFERVFSQMPIHNHYLRLALETGIVGLILYVGFFIALAAQAYRCIWSKDVFLSTTAMGILASMIGIFVYWMDDLFYGPLVQTQWWLLMGLVLVIRELTIQEGGAGFVDPRGRAAR